MNIQNVFKKFAKVTVKKQPFAYGDEAVIGQVENGFVFNNKYYPSIESLIPDLVDSLKKHFEQ
jgi:hypothetical protein